MRRDQRSLEKISIVVPCYNEQDALPLFYTELQKVLAGMDCSYEILLVDDGSRDRTLSVMKDLALGDSNVRYIAFSRNFGKEAAMYVGLVGAQGDYVAIMNADMQDPPSLLPEMPRLVRQDGDDSVATRREDRKGEHALRSWFPRMFYEVINCTSDTEIVDGARDFRLMKRSMRDAVVSIAESNPFSKGIFG